MVEESADHVHLRWNDKIMRSTRGVRQGEHNLGQLPNARARHRVDVLPFVFQELVRPRLWNHKEGGAAVNNQLRRDGPPGRSTLLTTILAPKAAASDGAEAQVAYWGKVHCLVTNTE